MEDSRSQPEMCPHCAQPLDVLGEGGYFYTNRNFIYGDFARSEIIGWECPHCNYICYHPDDDEKLGAYYASTLSLSPEEVEHLNLNWITKELPDDGTF